MTACRDDVRGLERRLAEPLSPAARVAGAYGFLLGVEHDTPYEKLLAPPESGPRCST